MLTHPQLRSTVGLLLGPLRYSRLVGRPRAGTDETPNPGGPIYQLRIYEIFEQNKADFHERFRGHAMPIMKTCDPH